jgi:uncharacterized protein YodC (DUF2158 family)
MDNSPNASIGSGDVVILKSGGPRMVVEALEIHAAENTRVGKPVGTTMARCIWHDASGAVQNHLFWPAMLVADPETAKRKAADQEAAERRAAELSKEADEQRIADERRAAELSKQQSSQEERSLQDA